MKQKGFGLSTNTVFGLIIAVFALIGLFWIARSTFRILMWAAPILLILTLFINYRVVIRYLEQIWTLPLIVGLGAVIFTIIGFPIVVAYLFFKAWMSKRNLTGENRPEFTDYQEIVEDQDNSAGREGKAGKNE